MEGSFGLEIFFPYTTESNMNGFKELRELRE